MIQTEKATTIITTSLHVKTNWICQKRYVQYV